MEFKWTMSKDKQLKFKDKIHNLACFEIVLNIMRMKISAKEDTSDEMQALCGFALECMFGDIDLSEEKLFESIMDLKDKKVDKFRKKLLRDMGVPLSVMNAPEVGEA